MKLFVTDYDDTLYLDDESIKETNKLLKKLKENDFLVVIATGRSFPSIHNQVLLHNIDYDYLICADGSIIYNNKKTIETMYRLNKEILKPFKEFYKDLNYEEIQFSYPEGYSNIYKDNDNLIGINVCLTSDKYTDELVNSFLSMKKDYPDYSFLAYRHPNYSYLCVKPIGISKSAGIKYIMNKHNIKKEDIYVIGDSSNDCEMIKDFNGAGVTWSNPDVLLITNKIYPNIDSYINDILNN